MKAKRAPDTRRSAPQREEDTAMRCLSDEERSKLAMDAWEPSLLRHLLTAQNRLTRRNKDKTSKR